MKFKVQKTDLFLNGKYYNENETYDFDEKSMTVKKLVEGEILIKAEKEKNSDAEKSKEKKSGAANSVKNEAEGNTEAKNKTK